MVEAVRLGSSQRSVARQFGVNLSVVQYWLRRAENESLDEVDWSDQPRVPHIVANRTSADVQKHILDLRTYLKEHSDLGEYGAEAIRDEMARQWITNLPSVRTINRILERHGMVDGKRRVRRPAPIRGWYLPDVADGRAELDQYDTVSGLIIEGGIEVEVLTGISLHGGLTASWVRSGIKASTVREALVEHWSISGRPDYAQFDNDNRFQGPHNHKDAIGSVIRLCLSLSVTPVFAPPRETGFQAAVESLNNQWQQKVWDRCHHESLEALMLRSDKYVAASRRKSAVRQEAAPKRHPFPEDWKVDLAARPNGRIIFLRRTNEHGQVHMLGRSFEVDKHWPYRLVRAEVQLPERGICFYALRRREPVCQPLLRELPYCLPDRQFRW